jgi:chromosome partitioning protein
MCSALRHEGVDVAIYGSAPAVAGDTYDEAFDVVVDEDLDDSTDEEAAEMPGGRHSQENAGRGKGSWLATLGLTPADLAGKVIAVAAYKGGVGKTMASYDLAYNLGGLAVDFDHDRGNLSRSWGYREENRTTRPLLDSLDRGQLVKSGAGVKWEGKAPRPLAGGPWRPDLVPCSAEWLLNQPDTNTLIAAMETWVQQWAEEYKCPIIIDTHPGGGGSTFAAVAIAHSVVVPLNLEERCMEATEGLVEELKSYRLMLVPNKVTVAPPEKYLKWLERMAAKAFVPVGPPISFYRQLGSRSRRMALCATDPTPAWAKPLVAELQELSAAVVRHVTA